MCSGVNAWWGFCVVFPEVLPYGVSHTKGMSSLHSLMKIFPISGLGLTDVTGIGSGCIEIWSLLALRGSTHFVLIMSSSVQNALKMSFSGHALMCKEFVRRSVKMKEDLLEEEKCFHCATNYSTNVPSAYFSHPNLDYS